jgi:hypothetical protein
LKFRIICSSLQKYVLFICNSLSEFVCKNASSCYAGVGTDDYESTEITQYNILTILISDIPVGMYMQKYILLFSVVQSKPTHTLATCDQATGFSSKSHHQADDRKA